jgi:hypothetical protein
MPGLSSVTGLGAWRRDARFVRVAGLHCGDNGSLVARQQAVACLSSDGLACAGAIVRGSVPQSVSKSSSSFRDEVGTWAGMSASSMNDETRHRFTTCGPSKCAKPRSCGRAPRRRLARDCDRRACACGQRRILEGIAVHASSPPHRSIIPPRPKIHPIHPKSTLQFLALKQKPMRHTHGRRSQPLVPHAPSALLRAGSRIVSRLLQHLRDLCHTISIQIRKPQPQIAHFLQRSLRRLRMPRLLIFIPKPRPRSHATPARGRLCKKELSGMTFQLNFDHRICCHLS